MSQLQDISNKFTATSEEWYRIIDQAPILMAKGAICWVCFESTQKNCLDHSKICNTCKRATYCSTECQQKDAESDNITAHKAICEKLATWNKSLELCNPRQWKHYFDEVGKVTSMPPLPNDDETRAFRTLVWYQPYCLDCHRATSELPPNSCLTLCPGCEVVHCCSTCSHATSNHSAHCNELQLASQVEKCSIENLKVGSLPWMEASHLTKPRQRYMPISDMHTMYEYHGIMAGNFRISDHFDTTLMPLKKVWDYCAGKSPYRMLSYTENLSYHLTILAALEKAIPNLEEKKSLEIHIINSKPIDFVVMTNDPDILLHLLPALETLTILYICGETYLRVTSPDIPACDACTRANRHVHHEVRNVDYNEYMSKEKKPDLAIMFQFNTRQIERETWRRFLRRPCPVVFTCTDEVTMTMEMVNLQTSKLNVLLRGEKNRWGSLRPHLERSEEGDNTITHDNQYWWIAGGGQGEVLRAKVIEAESENDENDDENESEKNEGDEYEDSEDDEYFTEEYTE